jgi:DNA-binding transcriptional ArsR family regulator
LTVLINESRVYLFFFLRIGHLMARNKADLLLHPERLRIVTELAQRQLTAKQLGALLPDIAQASLYRYLTALVEGGILEVVGETVVAGQTERTYGLVAGQGHLKGDDLHNATADDHLRYFTVYMTSLLAAYKQYLQHADLTRIGDDGMSYQRGVVYLSDDERAAIAAQLDAIVAQIMHNAPSAERKRYTLASIVIPDERTI